MRKWSNLFGNQGNNYKQLISDNRKAVDEYNENVLSTLLLIGWILILLPLALVPFSNTKSDLVPAYLLTFLSFFTLFLLFKLRKVKKYAIVGLYASFSILLSLSIYLSVIHSPHMRATFMLVGLVLTPLSFIDRPFRIRLFLVFWLVVHTVMAFYLKPQYALDDTINCLCAFILGGYFGNSIVKVRLESFDVKRLLIIEKDTDVLTGQLNRRKLFETLAHLETEESEKPSGIFMIDIDHFKEFNDSYGHAVGDECLTRFGELLTSFAQNFRLHFYRYGGEEFLAFLYGYSENELLSIAESLRIAVQNVDIAGHHITVSIGVAYCGDNEVKNYESVVARADQAVYAAKRAGRNTVYLQQSEM